RRPNCEESEADVQNGSVPFAAGMMQPDLLREEHDLLPLYLARLPAGPDCSTPARSGNPNDLDTSDLARGVSRSHRVRSFRAGRAWRVGGGMEVSSGRRIAGGSGVAGIKRSQERCRRCWIEPAVPSNSGLSALPVSDVARFSTVRHGG